MQSFQRHRDVGLRVLSLTEGETDTVSLMATIACELFHADERFDWLGFYRNVGNETLKIGPYQGGHGCLVIPFSRGICGRCAQTGQTQLIDDVECDSSHIACSATTRSELVIPIYDSTQTLIGVLDIDSDRQAAFDQVDADELQQLMDAVFRKI
ncbi:MAG: GAF domain-containing protein [Stappiaceae bacterium]